MHQTHKAIGILGGTFDPIHLGHLRMALELYQILDLASVHLIPTHHSSYRKEHVASAEQRFAMVNCAVQDEPALIADDREIRRKGTTYTIDTLIEMKKEFPRTPLCLLIGIDAFLSFTSWHRWNEILQHTHIVVAHRPLYHLPEEGMIADLINERLQQSTAYIHENLAGGILVQPITALEISATDIRKQIAMGKNPRYLLPDSVFRYIQEHGTYSISKI